ncbi:aromatic ring-hydroxylating oxygenase subunit alpha [Paraburkholderia ferrariae]|uniref:aromatic ring-hydroxylating oxygenase subunit alpha n=1 Tax=Paraburkholderia ferrariae TaxID=386056 RepID=UPI000693CAFB|nr:aromatic ring-hydroxylating dioxygenase subunit alpha [Paraburkholderia ferrariae]
MLEEHAHAVDETGHSAETETSGTLRDDFIRKDVYFSAEIARQEAAMLWMRTWQMACREEELPTIGSFVTYEIVGQSVIVVRTGEADIKAYQNSCPHRGRQLIDHQCGSVTRFYCPFHGWRWDLQGKNTYIRNAEDWDCRGGLSHGEAGLAEVKVGRWGGFVFINFDAGCEAFEKFIDPVPENLGRLEFEKMRFTWYKTMEIKCNWKVAIESFMESYHVPSTHFQTLPFLDAVTTSRERGKHGSHTNRGGRPFGMPAIETGRPEPEHFAEAFSAAIQRIARETGGVGTTSSRGASIVAEAVAGFGPEADPIDVMKAYAARLRQQAIDEGAGWHDLTAQDMAELGVDWSLFPNMVLVFGVDSSLVMRARPHGADPGRCLLDMWAMLRVAPAAASSFKREYYENYREHRADIPPLLYQDLSNMERVQAGMSCSSFKGSRLNPVQERQIYNMHRGIAAYLTGGWA